MEPSSLQPETWAELNFGGAQLGDTRRTKRLIHSAAIIAAAPGGSLPQTLQDPGALDGLYYLADTDTATHASVIAPHLLRTRQLMGQHASVVLVIKDWTELDYTTHKTLKRLGTIGNGSHRGYVCLNSLAVDAATREVIGLADQRLITRPQAPKEETRAAKRVRENRFSLCWLDSSDAVGSAPADAPPGQRWVEVCDREADTFEYLCRLFETGRSFVVRSKSDRNAAFEEDGEHRVGKLHAYARGLAGAYCKEVEVQAKPAQAATKKSPAKPAQPARKATVWVSSGVAWLTPPLGARRGQAKLQVGVVRVWEPSPPEGAEALEWILLTDLPEGRALTEAEATEVARWYECRWIVEDFHKGQKTGCATEKMQFETEARLEPMIALLSVVAVLLLQLRGLSRLEATKDKPAKEHVPELLVEVLAQWRHPTNRTRQKEMTVAEFYQALGRLGGHQNRRSDGPPGWIVLWRGWTQLLARVSAVRLARAERCAES